MKDYTTIDLGSDITKIRTNIAESIRLFKNKYFMSQFVVNLMGNKLPPETKQAAISRIEANISANGDPSAFENLIDKYRTKIFAVLIYPLLLVIIPEVAN